MLLHGKGLHHLTLHEPFNEHYKWSNFQHFITQHSSSVKDDRHGPINVTRMDCSLDVLWLLLSQMREREELMNWFFKEPTDLHCSIKFMAKYSGKYWNIFFYLFTDQRQHLDPNMHTRVRRCLDSFGRCLLELCKIHLQVNKGEVKELDLAMMINVEFIYQLGVTSSRQQKDIKFWFLMSLNCCERTSKLEQALIDIFDIDDRLGKTEL